jgi:RNA polymerase sigma-B factor
MHSATTSPTGDRGAAEPGGRVLLDDRAAALDDRAPALIAELAALAPGDPSRPRLRDETITAWLPMARRLARRYAGRGEALDDLVQAATIGLIKAVDRFDPAQCADFTGYAIPTILGEIKRHFRDRTWAVRVPRRIQEMRMAITNAGNELLHTLGRGPTVAEVAAHLQVTEEEVIEGLEGARAYRGASLSTPVGPDGSLELGDTLGAEDDDYSRTELHLSLKPAMGCLTDRERFIITARFYGNQTQSQIAAQIGVSQMHVSRLLANALNKLRAELGPDAY